MSKLHPEPPKPIRQCDPHGLYLADRAAIDAAVAAVLASGDYILGARVREFEARFAGWLGTRGTLGVASGTDALLLALRAAGVRPGDRVATVSHTATATVAAVELAGAVPLLVDVEPDYHTMAPDRLAAAIAACRERVAAVVPVHLYGQPCDMPAILAIAAQHGAAVIEDCAQAHGAHLDGRMVGGFGIAAAFSFYPTKNLGALGDGGAVAANDPALLEQVGLLRQYGWRQRHISSQPGANSRLDELQAAILLVKLARLDADNARRQSVAARYDLALADLPFAAPARRPGAVHVYHQYVLQARERERLSRFLADREIGTAIHYPAPVHRQPGYARLCALTSDALASTDALAPHILSLPMHPLLQDDEVARVIEALADAAAAGIT